jgi:hypothetical protein
MIGTTSGALKLQHVDTGGTWTDILATSSTVGDNRVTLPSLAATGIVKASSGGLLGIASASDLPFDSIKTRAIVHDTADTLRAYARARIRDSLNVLTPGRIGALPAAGGTANAMAKWTSSSVLGTGSWTDSTSVSRTTTTDTLVVQHAQIADIPGTAGGAVVFGYKGLNALGYPTGFTAQYNGNLAIAARGVGSSIASVAASQISQSVATQTATLTAGGFSVQGMSSTTDTITSLSAGGITKAVAGSGAITLASASDLPLDSSRAEALVHDSLVAERARLMDRYLWCDLGKSFTPDSAFLSFLSATSQQRKFPANTLRVGSVIELTIRGAIYGDGGAKALEFIFGPDGTNSSPYYFGGPNPITFPTAMRAFEAHATLTCVAIGASGTFGMDLRFTTYEMGSLLPASIFSDWRVLAASGAYQGVNTTVDNYIDFKTFNSFSGGMVYGSYSDCKVRNY